MKRRKAFIALALTMCMLVPTSVSAVENNQPAGQQTESVDGQTDETTEFTTKDPNELSVVDAKDPDEGTKDDPKDEEEKIIHDCFNIKYMRRVVKGFLRMVRPDCAGDGRREVEIF